MIFTLCGSARFEPVWHEANKQLGLAGHISFSLMTFPSVEGSKSWYTDEQKTMLDLMHLAKIDASDAVLMLNVGDYLGESSLRELAWARHKKKHIFFLQRSKYYKTLTDVCWLIGCPEEDERVIDTVLPSESRAALIVVCGKMEANAPI